jgi:pimeloyl-ACP methyl ester carboxylesterase
MKPEPFTLRVEESVLQDLQRRLDGVHWIPELVDGGWSWGADLPYLRSLVAYWRHGFDWRARVEALNRFSHFRARVQGTGIHFIRERGKGPAPVPLLITHGWPGSFAEMTRILPHLTDPASHGGRAEDAFDVVVPSMPGFGFSDVPTSSGTSVFAMADLFVALMAGLGYERFFAQGGDFGAGVSTALALGHPSRLLGLHLNYIPGSYLPHLEPEAELAGEETSFLREQEAWYEQEGGYSHVQGTRPDCLSVALQDSPVGLAAWIIEKFRAWGDCNGDVESRFSKDELLTNVMIYWCTGTIASANRLYVEGRRRPMRLARGQRVSVPTAVARFPLEAPFPPRAWVERGYDVVRWTEMPRGGHFAALEEPELLAQDVREFCRKWRE